MKRKLKALLGFIVLAMIVMFLIPDRVEALRDRRIRAYPLAATITGSTHLPEGTIAYAADTNTFYYYIGSTWTAYGTFEGSGVAVGTFTTTANGATELLYVVVDPATAANADEGQIAFRLDNGTSVATFGRVDVALTDITAGAESAAIGIDVWDSDGAGVMIEAINAVGITGQDEVVINTAGVDLDFRVESDTIINAFFVRASDSRTIITGATTTDAFHVDIGTALFDEGVDMVTAATHLETIRFCGNGPDGATATFMGPVLLDDTEADLVYGGAGCDALENVTEATADAPWHPAFAFNPVAMVCVGRCTGATAANDAIVFQLRDDTVDVTGMTCTTSVLTGDDVPQQCTVRDSTPATVAAASTVAIDVTMTDDDCNDVGDDFECLVYISF